MVRSLVSDGKGVDAELPGAGARHQGGTRLALGVAYGLVAGAAVGSILLALTGELMWLSIAPGIGLIVGLAVPSLADRSTEDGR